jgi:DNA-binding NtrC family response regulator
MTACFGVREIVGEEPHFATIKAKLPLIANAEATVLATGETGTGKEVIARAIHYLSRRTHAPFLCVNCGAIPTNLFESEVFGHRRGAFTDARTSVPGLISEAEGGTVFLDEVDAIPLLAQVKLLHFLQDKVYRPLGAANSQRADVRIIAATNSDLEAKVAAGEFREDLYYRLNIITIALPPLRERRRDIPLLARYFLTKYASAESRRSWEFAPGVLEMFQSYPWPGNIRELENMIQQIVALLSPGMIRVEDLPPRLRPRTSVVSAKSFREAKARSVAGFEQEYAARLLAEHGGNITRAAQAAGKDRRAFARLVKKYGIMKTAFSRWTRPRTSGQFDPTTG